MEKSKGRRESKKGKSKRVSSAVILWDKWILFLRKKARPQQPRRRRTKKTKKSKRKPVDLRISVLKNELKRKNCIPPAEKISVFYRSWENSMSTLRKQNETAVSAEVHHPETPTKTLLARKNQAQKGDRPRAPKQAATPECVPQQIGAPEGFVQHSSTPKDDPQKDVSGQAMEKRQDYVVNVMADLDEQMNDLLNGFADQEEHTKKAACAVICTVASQKVA
ncbi:uncharacterized protein LOC119474291 [Sebastes umbrosus]|uniref:uncharacterized protein LOC119474291 n=1 Tax=Sebastes umbrosus TaxID=72105 RepID=UPI00189FA365|nr:uncharacterized protein LOC119474291 [Sebastes umbrosus]